MSHTLSGNRRAENDELQSPQSGHFEASWLESVVGAQGCGTGTGVELFLQEHRNMRRLLGLIDAELSLTGEGQAPDYALMLTVIHYLTRYIDNFHHAREDGALELAVLRLPRLTGVAAVVAEQHESVLFSGGALWALLERAFTDQPVLRFLVLDAGRSYSRRLSQHLKYEEDALFPVLMEVLEPEAWAAIDMKYGPVSDPLFGPVVDEPYRQLRARLQGPG